MAGLRKPSERSQSKRPPATTPEGRENQLVALSYDLAEKQIRAGTASAQVVTHFLKLGSSRERLEQAKIKQETSVLIAKAEAMASSVRIEELYADAMNAMTEYKGGTVDEYDD